MRIVDSPNQDARPAGVEIGLVVVHSISLPPGEFGGDAIERLFTNRLDPAAHPYFESIAHLRVSSHFLVRRDGELVRFVPVERRAWHAGASSWRGRSRCNDFSVGIELEGSDDSPFEDVQYRELAELIARLAAALPLKAIAAHSDIAPGRKTDPGPRFDWPRLLAALAPPAGAVVARRAVSHTRCSVGSLVVLPLYSSAAAPRPRGRLP
jgi:AmpD protein